ncbi:hypothetical protein [Bacillus pumilus]|nr:hypothetical protein [Bacillus pumilus]
MWFEEGRDWLGLGKGVDGEESIYLFDCYELERVLMSGGVVEEKSSWSDF